MFVDVFCNFWILYGLPEAREVFKNLPGARGSVFPKYEPEISILDPIQLIFVFLIFQQKPDFWTYMPRGLYIFVIFENVDLENLNIYNAT